MVVSERCSGRLAEGRCEGNPGSLEKSTGSGLRVMCSSSDCNPRRGLENGVQRR